MAAKHPDQSAIDPDLLLALRTWIRGTGVDYLDDPNITSVGVGHKVRAGRRTDEISVQFTVGAKAEPEELKSLGTELIPDSVTVAGIEVPTDVLQRTYLPDFRVVTEAVSPHRKRRIDPVRPGVSVGHPDIAAGTIGAIVYDRANGTPYLLSNWHVLHGETGALGDTVVQPGVHDDNRTDQTAVGTLVRSHLGVAGDCAIATVTGRGVDPSILDLDVAPTDLGEPELGDKVVKSGRTTGVTHGRVRRIETIAELDYGMAGSQRIGCFEIETDRAKPPAGGEISAGGDSGAAWLFKGGNGKPTTVLAGLHFGGEVDGDRDEHALACLPRSVFEKLDITLVRPERTEPEGETGGYDPHFLGVDVAVPALDDSLIEDAALVNGSSTVPYTHFSLALSKSRRFAFWVAWNIDGGGLLKLSRKNIPFVKDKRIPAEFQTGNELYQDNRLDRGHLARRADLLWGGQAQASKANRDSFHYTNITPQMDDFNQSARDGVWGKLEDALFAEVEVDDLKVSAIGGPVFGADDRLFRGVRIPREFWKVIVFVEGGALKAKAFLLTQSLNQLESLDLDEFRTFQVPLAELERRCLLRFAPTLHDAGAGPEAVADPQPLDSPADIDWS